MPHHDAGIGRRCAFAAFSAMLILSANSLPSSANDGRSSEPATTTPALDPRFQFPEGSQPLIIAERPTGRAAKGQAGGQPAATRPDMRVEVVSEGTSSRAARKAGIAAVPVNKLTPEAREKAQQILKSASIFRELPTLAFEVEPAVYQFFIQHPDVAVGIWRVMGVSEFKMWQTGPVAFEADVGDGTVGAIEVLYRNGGDCLVMCNGVFSSPLLVKPIQANALMHLQTEFKQNENGRKLVQHKLKLFVDFPSTTIETAAKIMTPVTNMIVDRNFQEVSLFVHMMSLAMAKRPDWVQGIVEKVDGVLEPSKNELMVLTSQVYAATQPGGPAAPGQTVISGNASPADDSAAKRVASGSRNGATR